MVTNVNLKRYLKASEDHGRHSWQHSYVKRDAILIYRDALLHRLLLLH